MDLPVTIINNPLFALRIAAISTKPSWLCSHIDAKVTDFETKRYFCMKCNPRGGAMRRIPMRTIMDTVAMNKL